MAMAIFFGFEFTLQDSVVGGIIVEIIGL